MRVTRATRALLCGGCLLATTVHPGAAVFEDREFDDTEVAAAYQGLIEELRCLVCQNQNIADSNATLAKDLRDQVYEMLNQGSSRDDVIEFMVARYGDFVTYRPPINAATVLLWTGPFAAVLVGGGLLAIRLRGDKTGSAESVSGSDASEQAAQAWLQRQAAAPGED